MNYIKSLLVLFVFSLALLIFHSAGLQSYFYWSIGWYDVVSHILGGIIVGLFAMLFAIGTDFSKTLIFWRGMAFALGVVFFWELFEYRTGITYLSSKYVVDTLFDMFFGFIGSFVAITISLRFFKR